MKTFKSFLKEEYKRQTLTEDKIGKAVSLFKDIFNIKNKLESINPKLTEQIFNKLSDLLEHYKGNIEQQNWDRIIVPDFIEMLLKEFQQIVGTLKKNLKKNFSDKQKEVIQGFIENLERLLKEVNNFKKIALN